MRSDASDRQALGRHAEIARMFGATDPRSGPMSDEAASAWLAGLGGPGTIEWIVEADGRLLGTARLHSFDGRGGARYAIGLLNPARLGQGLGTEATQLVLDHAFDALGLERVEVAVLQINVRAIQCYERCGFRHISRAVGAIVVDGDECYDLVMEARSGDRQLSQERRRLQGVEERRGTE